MKIALTYTGSGEKHDYYVRWLKGESHEDIEVVTLVANDNNLYEMKNCDALVLSGGRDIHPKYYKNQNLDYANAPADFDEKRDLFEIDAFNLARNKGIPVLAICRGMQLVNCIQGGTLIQDMGIKLNKIHRVKDNQDKVHEIKMVDNTIVNEIAKTSLLPVNSAHHQAIGDLGVGLKINCTAGDGNVEGLEWNDPLHKPFLLGVQWHPERMFKFQMEDSPLSKGLRIKFLEEIKKPREIKSN